MPHEGLDIGLSHELLISTINLKGFIDSGQIILRSSMPADLESEFQNLLRHEITKTGVLEIARRTKLNQGFISRMAKGRTGFTIPTVIKLAEALGYSKFDSLVLAGLIQIPDKNTTGIEE